MRTTGAWFAAAGCFGAVTGYCLNASADLNMLTLAPAAISAARKEAVRFSIELVGHAPRKVVLERDTGGGVFKRVGTLNDKGKGGDLLRNDGFYGLRKALRISVEGTLRFRAKAIVKDPVSGAIITLTSEPQPLEVTAPDTPNSLSDSDPSHVVVDPAYGNIICDEVIVSVDPGISTADALLAVTPYGEIIGRIPGLHLYQLRVPGVCAPGTASAAIALLEQIPGVTGAAPNLELSLSSAVNDPAFDAIGQQDIKTIHADAVWERYTTGSSSMSIAVVDTGINYNHPDLGLFGTDGGRVVRGASLTPLIFIPFQNEPEPLDEEGHGTEVASIIGAKTNNDYGIAGITWQNPILAVRAYRTAIVAAAGIKFAVDHGAKIINVSLSGSVSEPGVVLPGICHSKLQFVGRSLFGSAVQYALDHERLVVAAAGNNTCQYPPDGPAAVDAALSVGAIYDWGDRAPDSNYGSWVDLYAPGVSNTVLNWQRTGRLDWDRDQGTSFAAPIVSGAAALLWSLGPTVPARVIAATLKASAVATGYSDPAENKIRRVDVLAAIELAVPRSSFLITSGALTGASGPTPFIVTSSRPPVSIAFADGSTDHDGRIAAWRWYIDGRIAATTSGFAHTFRAGTFDIRLAVTDNDGFLSESRSTVQVIRVNKEGACRKNGDCLDNDVCTVNERCVAGACVRDQRSCDDGEPCTDDSCDSQSGCVHTTKADHTECNDGNQCTRFDTCFQGKCAGVEVLNITPVGLGFPATPLGNCAPDESFTIDNPAGCSTIVGSTTASPEPPFSIVAGQTLSIPGGGSSIVTVRFCPSSIAQFDGQVSFSTNRAPAARPLGGAGTAAPTFTIGDRVQTRVPILYVRSIPSGTLLGQVPLGTLGTIQGGPTSSGNLMWWHVAWDTGLTGWSAATDGTTDYFVKYTEPICPDNHCNGTETCATCPQDCGMCSFVIGDRVQTTVPILNVRSTASGTLLGQVPLGTLGTIQGGPTSSGNLMWWHVAWDTGLTGWSAATDGTTHYFVKAP